MPYNVRVCCAQRFGVMDYKTIAKGRGIRYNLVHVNTIVKTQYRRMRFKRKSILLR